MGEELRGEADDVEDEEGVGPVPAWCELSVLSVLSLSVVMAAP